MRLAGLEESAAVFGRLQAVIYPPLLAFAFLVPQRILRSYQDNSKEIDFGKLRKSQPLFLLLGTSASVVSATASKKILEGLAIQQTETASQMALGFSFFGALHTLSFAGQNVCYATDNLKTPLIANSLGLLTTNITSLATLYFAPKSWQALLLGLSISAGELPRTITFEAFFQQSNKQARRGRNKRSNCCKIFKVWFSYKEALPFLLALFSEQTTNLLNLWQASLAADALSALNLALPLRALFTLLTRENIQSHMADAKAAKKQNNKKQLKSICKRAACNSLIPPAIYLGVAAAAPALNYYGFEPKACLIIFFCLAVLNIFESISMVMKRIMLSDNIAFFPALIINCLLWGAFALALFEPFNSLAGVMITRTAAYAIEASCSTALCLDWMNKGDNSVAKKAETKLRAGGSWFSQCLAPLWSQSSSADQSATEDHKSELEVQLLSDVATHSPTNQNKT
jgi:hypothetical protein